MLWWSVVDIVFVAGRWVVGKELLTVSSSPSIFESSAIRKFVTNWWDDSGDCTEGAQVVAVGLEPLSPSQVSASQNAPLPSWSCWCVACPGLVDVMCDVISSRVSLCQNAPQSSWSCWCVALCKLHLKSVSTLCMVPSTIHLAILTYHVVPVDSATRLASQTDVASHTLSCCKSWLVFPVSWLYVRVWLCRLWTEILATLLHTWSSSDSLAQLCHTWGLQGHVPVSKTLNRMV